MTRVHFFFSGSKRTMSCMALWSAATRPHLLIPAWGCAATGAAWAAASAESPELLGWQVWLGLAAWSMALVASHLLNLAADRASDAANGKNLFWHGRISTRKLYGAAGVVAVAAATLALVAGGLAIHASLLALLLGAVYSLSPARLAARPGWDLAVNVLGYGLIAPWFGVTLVGIASASPPFPPAVTLVLVPLVAAAFLWTTLLDLPGDAATGKTTFAVRWSRAATLGAAATWGVMAACAAWFVGFAPDVLGTGHPETAAEPTACWGGIVWASAVSVVALLGVTLKFRRLGVVWIRRAIFLSVAASAVPGLLRWPLLLILGATWLGLAYSCLHWAGRTRANPQ